MHSKQSTHAPCCCMLGPAPTAEPLPIKSANPIRPGFCCCSCCCGCCCCCMPPSPASAAIGSSRGAAVPRHRPSAPGQTMPLAYPVRSPPSREPARQNEAEEQQPRSPTAVPRQHQAQHTREPTDHDHDPTATNKGKGKLTSSSGACVSGPAASLSMTVSVLRADRQPYSPTTQQMTCQQPRQQWQSTHTV